MLILSVWMTPHANCKNVITADTTRSPFSFDLLPEINRDLKLCDLIKIENGLLKEKVELVSTQASDDKQARQTAEAALNEVRKSLKKEKRKRIVGNVFRTLAEVAAVIVVIKIL